MEASPAPPSDGVRIVDSTLASAGVGRWVVVGRDRAAEPTWDADRDLLFAGDVRLYNRPELAASLDVRQPLDAVSDLELARLAYLKWGYDSPRFLVGDFAFAAWSDRERALFAARDQFGMRPLYYSSLADGFVVASHVCQILALVDRPTDRVSAHQVLDLFTLQTSDPKRSFFEGIKRVRPGHHLIARMGRIDEARYWRPQVEPDHSTSYADNCELLRTAFRRAVRDRLESDHPIVAHSSGGFDSSTILVAADDVYRAERERPPLVMASATAPGFEADESHYMDAVAARVSFEGIRWNVVDSTPVAFPGLRPSGPVLRTGMAGGGCRDLTIAHERGARVLISGFLGDDVWYAAGVLRDFVRHGQLLPVFRYLRRAGLGWSGLRPLFYAGLGLLPPPIAVVVADKLQRRKFNPGPPGWMGPALQALYPPDPEPIDPPPLVGQSHLSCGLWSVFTHPRREAAIEAMIDYGVQDGIEVRLPYADVRLLECVLRIPWEQRDPRGHHRRTGRDALGPLLPPEFAARNEQSSWTPVWDATARRTLISLAPFIRQGPWASAAFVDRGIARGRLESLLANGADADYLTLLLVLQIGALEAWLRTLLL